MREWNFHGSRTITACVAVALGCVTTAGCSSDTNGPTPASEVATSYDDLTTDLSICQKSRDTCLDVLDGNRSRADGCRDELDGCRSAVKEARQEVHTALRACVDAARACVHAAADGGADPRECGQTFHACVRAATPPPPPLPPCVQSLKDCLAGSVDGDGGGGRDARKACFTSYETCAIEELPPCAQNLARCVQERGDVRACFQASGECRKFRATHDGGVPTAP